MNAKYTQKPISTKDNPRLFYIGDILEGESPDSWFWFGRRLAYGQGRVATPHNFLGWYMRIMLPLFTFSDDNFSAEYFEEQQGWSVPALNISLRWFGLKFQWYQHFLGPSKDLNTNPVYDPKTQMCIEGWERDELQNYKAVKFWKVIDWKIRLIDDGGAPPDKLIVYPVHRNYNQWHVMDECDCTQCKGV